MTATPSPGSVGRLERRRGHHLTLAELRHDQRHGPRGQLHPQSLSSGRWHLRRLVDTDTNFRGSGLFTATLSARIVLCSATLRLGGTSYSVSREFSTNGSFFGVILRGGPAECAPGAAPTRPKFDQSHDRPGHRLSVDGGHRGRSSRLRPPIRRRKPAATTPCASSGASTRRLRREGTVSDDDTVGASGSVLFNGNLGDGTKVTQSTIVSSSGQWPFYAFNVMGRGSIWVGSPLPVPWCWRPSAARSSGSSGPIRCPLPPCPRRAPDPCSSTGSPRPAGHQAC